MILDVLTDEIRTDTKDRLEADITHIGIGLDDSTPEAENNSQLDEELLTYFGDASSRFDVTDEGGNTMRVTWDGTGTDPNFVTSGLQIGDIIRTKAPSPFHDDNEGDHEVTGVAEEHFEYTDAGGQVESDIVLGAADILGMTKRKVVSWNWDAGTGILSASVTWDQSEGNGNTITEFGLFDGIDLDETIQVREIMRQLVKDNSIHMKVELQMEIIVTQ